MTVLANTIVRIAENLGKGGSISALEALVKMGGMMPSAKTDVAIERINKIQFITKSPKEDIDKLYPDIKRMCERYGMNPGKPEDYEELKEY